MKTDSNPTIELVHIAIVLERSNVMCSVLPLQASANDNRR